MLLIINHARRFCLESAWPVVSAIAATAIVCAAVYAPRTWADDPNATVATVGDHKITEKDLDAKVKPQLDQMHAMLADRDKLSVPDYLKKEYSGKNAVTDAQAKAFYEKNKGQSTAPYDQIKPQLLQMMNRQALLERLRKNQPVKILLEPKRVVVDSSGHPALGSKDAPVTIVEFTDFQCPFCKATEATLKQLHDKYGDKIRVVHMDFPLPFHSHALDAAKAARCANEQGKFWPFHDALFADQSKLAPTDLKATAKTLGMNSTKFNTCFDSAKYDSQIKADQAVGEKVGVDGTPAFFIDGRPLTGAQPAPKFEELINDELANGGTTKQASAR
jgi:protein-disulfide isomerase